MIKESVQILAFIRSIKVRSKEKNQVVDGTFIPKDGFPEIILHHIIELAVIDDIQLLWIMDMENRITGRMERRNRALYMKISNNTLLQLIYGLICKRDNQNLFWINLLLLN